MLSRYEKENMRTEIYRIVGCMKEDWKKGLGQSSLRLRLLLVLLFFPPTGSTTLAMLFVMLCVRLAPSRMPLCMLCCTNRSVAAGMCWQEAWGRHGGCMGDAWGRPGAMDMGGMGGARRLHGRLCYRFTWCLSSKRERERESWKTAITSMKCFMYATYIVPNPCSHHHHHHHQHHQHQHHYQLIDINRRP